jgi:mono/diheme cytochrome c family protein
MQLTQPCLPPRNRACLGVLWFLISVLGVAAPSAFAAGNAEELFVRRIAPLFHEKCLACHGNDEAKIKGGLDMRTLAATLKGGDSEEPGLLAGKPEESPLYLAVTREHDDWEAMPPKEADKLYAEQIAWIKDWIAGGAPWPDDSRVQAIAKANEAKWSAEDGITVKTTGALSPEWANRKYKPEGLWAYQPVRKIGVMEYWSDAVSSTPALRDSSPPPHPIDAFIAAKKPTGLTAAPAADRVTLIRRATFDLLGLPPKPEEVEAFVKDARPDPEAFAAAIERLLDSPHYGERMAQHWLDVTRYADSSGFANDYERGNAWRYRDYVVRAFNRDKPYDQFIREQIAGDEIDANDPEKIIATGFLRMGPWELTGMEVAKIARQRFLDDVTNAWARPSSRTRCNAPAATITSSIPCRRATTTPSRPCLRPPSSRSGQRPFLARREHAGFEERAYLEKSLAPNIWPH